MLLHSVAYVDMPEKLAYTLSLSKQDLHNDNSSSHVNAYGEISQGSTPR